MTHIFRKYSGYNPNEIRCWSPSTVIDENSFDIETAAFTRGASKAGSSIPSPLARLELFDTAFRIVADERTNNLSGKTLYHQLVSDVLDVMQLLFNTDKENIGPGKKLWFKEWNVRENIDKLKSRGENHSHNLLARSLEQIFTDPQNQNYAGMESIFLIYYENKLLGGTSPLTLFFTSPNWSRYIADGQIANVPQSADNDVFFDDDYRALHQRDLTFVKYLYRLFLHNKAAFAKAEGLRKYINKTVDTHFPGWRQDPEFLSLASADPGMAAQYMENSYTRVVTNIDNKLLTVNGLFFYHRKAEEQNKQIAASSDFLIRATHHKHDSSGVNYLPLVLVDGMNLPGDYMEKNAPWNANTRVKEFYHRAIPLQDRTLPQGNDLTAIRYPFVTTDDFLEETLLEMPYQLNSQKFYTGTGGDCKYLLPVKKQYFNFFTLRDLKDQLHLTIADGMVKAELKVPIINRKGITHIVLTRQYEKGKGQIVECRAGIGIYPFYQVNDPDPALQLLNDYTVLLAEKNEKIRLRSLEFFSFHGYASEATPLKSESTERSNWTNINAGDATATSRYYRVKEAFDYLELGCTEANGNPCTGLIVPDFEKRAYNKNNLTRAYTFGIDFGTSNTHIAYMENGEAMPRPFEITENDQQMVLLNAPGTDSDPGTRYSFYGQFPGIDLTLRREFLPPVILSGSTSAISFPFKTASCETAGFNSTEKSATQLFTHINIGYYIDQEEKKADGNIAGNTLYTTNLKWLLENNNDDTNKSRVRFFLQQLLLQIKAKMILNNGRPDQLQVVWSVPLSMEKGNRTLLSNLLGDAFKTVFGNCGATLSAPIPEAVAPYFYLTRSDSGIQETANVVNVDIGGGTTDVMMFMESSGNREDKYLSTSFRFAGSDLWGGGYRSKRKDNGFIQNYFAYQAANNIQPLEIKYLNKVKDDGNMSADDLVSLLFRYNDKFRFSDSITIGNPDLSLLLYLHYSAIIYHLVQIFEMKQYPLPRYLSFTGKGSQYIRLICGDDKRELEAFTRLLLKAYAKQPLQGSFHVHLNDNPKEITANGAVLYALADPEEKAKYDSRSEFIHPGFEPEGNPALTERMSGGQRIPISETVAEDSPLTIAVLNNLNTFLEKTLDNREIVDFLNEFKVKNTKNALADLRWNNEVFNGEGLVYDSYKKVVKDLHKLDHHNPLPESLFFYALKDALYRLSKNILTPKTQPAR